MTCMNELLPLVDKVRRCHFPQPEAVWGNPEGLAT